MLLGNSFNQRTQLLALLFGNMCRYKVRPSQCCFLHIRNFTIIHFGCVNILEHPRYKRQYTRHQEGSIQKLPRRVTRLL